MSDDNNPPKAHIGQNSHLRINEDANKTVSIDDMMLTDKTDRSLMELTISDSNGYRDEFIFRPSQQKELLDVMNNNSNKELTMAQLFYLNKEYFSQVGYKDHPPPDIPDPVEAYSYFLDEQQYKTAYQEYRKRNEQKTEPEDSRKFTFKGHSPERPDTHEIITGTYTSDNTPTLSQTFANQTQAKYGTLSPNNTHYAVIELPEQQLQKLSGLFQEKGIPHLIGENTNAILIEDKMTSETSGTLDEIRSALQEILTPQETSSQSGTHPVKDFSPS